MKNIPVRDIPKTRIEPDFSGSFSIRDIEEILSGKDMVQELHRHDFYFILALKKGAGRHEIDFTPYDVHDHAVFFMRPGQVHQLTLKAGSKGYLMQFKKSFYRPGEKASGELWRKPGHPNLCQLEVNTFGKLFSLLNDISVEHSERQEGYQEIIKANLNIFFIELVRHRKQQRTPTIQTDKISYERLDKLTALIETHLTSHKLVSQYADMMHLSTYQLNAITKETLGKTCSDLINEYIILEAKRYLLATSNQVNQIAYHLGYEDVSYFIRFFKKQTGLTPEIFRQEFR